MSASMSFGFYIPGGTREYNKVEETVQSTTSLIPEQKIEQIFSETIIPLSEDLKEASLLETQVDSYRQALKLAIPQKFEIVTDKQAFTDECRKFQTAKNLFYEKIRDIHSTQNPEEIKRILTLAQQRMRDCAAAHHRIIDWVIP